MSLTHLNWSAFVLEFVLDFFICRCKKTAIAYGGFFTADGV
jgi:hypothetical protein